jgi:hypothetical protein
LANFKRSNLNSGLVGRVPPNHLLQKNPSLLNFCSPNDSKVKSAYTKVSITVGR